MFFFWDNLGWGELGCYGGGVLRGAPTPRIDALAGEGLQLLNFNVEAQCTPSRSALLTGRHAIRSGTQSVDVTGGADGMTRWEVTIAGRCPTSATPRGCGASGTWAAIPSSAARPTSALTRRCGPRARPTRSSGRCSRTSPTERSRPSPTPGRQRSSSSLARSTRGGAGHSGEGRQPGKGTQPGGGAGQFGGGLNRYPIPISQPATAAPDSSPHPAMDRGTWRLCNSSA